MFDTLISSLWMFAAAYAVFFIATKVLRRVKGFGIVIVLLHVFWVALAYTGVMQIYNKMFGSAPVSSSPAPSAPASAPSYQLPGASDNNPSTPARPANNPYAK